MDLLMAITTLCESYFKANSRESITQLKPECFLRTLSLLHESIHEVHAASPKLQIAIVSLCERIFLRFPEDQHVHVLVPNTFAYYIAAALEPQAKQAEVKKLVSLKQMLAILDLSEENIMHDLLLRCAISPLFLSSKEGKKFISVLMQLNPQMSHSIYTVFVPQVLLQIENLIFVDSAFQKEHLACLRRSILFSVEKGHRTNHFANWKQLLARHDVPCDSRTRKYPFCQFANHALCIPFSKKQE